MGSTVSAFTTTTATAIKGKMATSTTSSLPVMVGGRENVLASAIQQLSDLGINLLAIDFDQTILDIHTGGRWTGACEELFPHVRPEFQQLISASLQNDIQIAVVTFTIQTSFVRGVLEHMVGQERAASIPVRGNDGSWSYEGEGSRHGKQAHIASAVEELEQDGAIEITKRTTVLIDDDRRNVRHALLDGTRAVWFNPDKPHHMLLDLARLV